MKYISLIFFKKWEKVDLLFSMLGFISLIFSNLGWKYQLLFILSGLILSFIVKLIRQCISYIDSYYTPLKVISSAQGEGMYVGRVIIKIENNGQFRDNTLVTLFCKGTGIYQPICLLQIINASFNEDIIAVQLFPSPLDLNIDNYLNQEALLRSLYISPLINKIEFNII